MRHLINALFFGGLCLLCPALAGAQTEALATNSMNDASSTAGDEAYGLGEGNIVVAPIPISNPAIGSGLTLGGGYLFKLDPEARTSVIGVGALRTDNGSKAAAAFVNLAFGDNEWLFNFAAGEADLRYDLFGDPVTFPVRQEGRLANLGLAYGVTPDLSFGAQMRYLDTFVSPDLRFGTLLPESILADVGLEVVTLALTGDWDRRDNTDYPTRGTRIYGEVMQGRALNLDKRRYEKGFVQLDGFYPLAERTVLAGRAVACSSSEDTPFFDKCSLGLTDMFRGYSSTRFLDDRLASVQVEVRQRLTGRIGAVAFAGAGWTGEDFDALSDNGTKSAVGLGARFRVSRDFPVDFSVDVTRNNEGEELFYVYVGQRW